MATERATLVVFPHASPANPFRTDISRRQKPIYGWNLGYSRRCMTAPGAVWLTSTLDTTPLQGAPFG